MVRPFFYSTPTAERRPSSGERYLRCFVKTGVKFSIEFSFNVDCGGSGPIRMV